MTIYLLEGTLQVDIFYECEDQDLEDNVCIRVIESCPPSEKLFRAGQTHIFLTPEQASELGNALLQTARNSESFQKE